MPKLINPGDTFYTTDTFDPVAVHRGWCLAVYPDDRIAGNLWDSDYPEEPLPIELEAHEYEVSDD